MEKPLKIQVLISTYGPDGPYKIAALPHAPYPGVEYLIGWQNHDNRPVPKQISEREDFRVIRLESKGLCNNRNALLEEADADLTVISDDDLSYRASHFENLIKGVETFPNADFYAFRYQSKDYPKSYPDKSFDLNKPPKVYFVTSMELVFNRKKITRDFGNADMVRLNPYFGVNGDIFGSGEEDILVKRLLRKGMKGMYVPADICENTQSTTGEREMDTAPFIFAKGAAMKFMHPLTWPLRMILHALRSKTPFLKYCRWWISGVKKAASAKVFKNYR